jgi:hypothetical protein
VLAAPASEREELMVALVLAEAAAVLGQGEPALIGPGDRFTDLGMSSFTALELSTRLRACGVEAPPALVFDQPTPLELARCLLASLTQS